MSEQRLTIAVDLGQFTGILIAFTTSVFSPGYPLQFLNRL